MEDTFSTSLVVFALNVLYGRAKNARTSALRDFRKWQMNFKKIAWWFPRNFDALNTILRSRTTYDQYFGPLPALERAFLAPPMHNWSFSAYNSRTKASTWKWVSPSKRSRSVDAKTCINFCVLTNIFWFYAIWMMQVLAVTGNLLSERTILKFFWKKDHLEGNEKH